MVGAMGRNWSAVRRVNRIPIPSIRARMRPPTTALPAIAAAPSENDNGKPFHTSAPHYWALERHHTSGCQDSTGGEAANDWIPGIFLLPQINQRAVYRGEHAAPHGKVAPGYGRPLFDRDQTPYGSPLETLQRHATKQQLEHFARRKRRLTKHTLGALRKPLMLWKIPPPMTPMVKAPPQSSTILQGLATKQTITNWNIYIDKTMALLSQDTHVRDKPKCQYEETKLGQKTNIRIIGKQYKVANLPRFTCVLHVVRFITKHARTRQEFGRCKEARRPGFCWRGTDTVFQVALVDTSHNYIVNN